MEIEGDDPYGVLAFIESNSSNLESIIRGITLPQPTLSQHCGCGGMMERGVNDLENTCSRCGRIAEISTEDDGAHNDPTAGRLRLVGSGASTLQPEMYRSSAGISPENQRKLCLDEYLIYRQKYINMGGRAYPLNACDLAAGYYAEIQKQFIKRSENKKVIMAHCLWEACLQIGFAPKKAEIADFMQLQRQGIARGTKFVRGLISDGKISSIAVDQNPCQAEINTLWLHLEMGGETFQTLKEAVYDLVELSTKLMIGTHSVIKTKVAGASYIVLKRCKHPEVDQAMSIEWFCDKAMIRKNTIDRYIKEVNNYSSKFQELYNRYDLNP